MKITICMGSSCFVRGNKENLKIIQDFVKEHKLKVDINIDGVLCKNECNEGPNVCLDGKWFTKVDQAHMISLLEDILPEK